MKLWGWIRGANIVEVNNSTTHSILLYNFFLEIWNHHHPSPSPCFPTPAPCSRHKDFLSQKSIANPGATISTLGDILTNPYEVGRQLQRLDPKTRLQKNSSILDLFPQPTINVLNLVQSNLAHPHHPSIHPSIHYAQTSMKNSSSFVYIIHSSPHYINTCVTKESKHILSVF